MSEQSVAAPPAERLKVTRFFTTAGVDPFDTVKWSKRDAVITHGADEKFRQNDVEAPAQWSDRAVNIVAEKYFRIVNGQRETSVKQMLRRVSQEIAARGFVAGVFSGEDAEIFEAELRYMLLHQKFAFNSPVWFNVGVVPEPQASACFIQKLDDTMESITHLVEKEMRLFKGGSGTGTNLSTLRSSYEKLSGGGYASGPVSFLEVYDRGAGVTKSGGTTRRAAKLNCMDASHPDILEQKSGLPGFITCKSKQEQVARDLFSTGKYSAEFNVAGNVYDLVGFQNVNTSVRAPDAFMRAVASDTAWETKKVTTGEVVHAYRAKDLFRAMAQAAWDCGDPGIQFDDTINNWHTCKASGRINASNPCSEFMFLDDSACNLGSLNLLSFLEGSFNVEAFAHACQIATIAQEVLVGFSGYPSPEIAANSHKFRPLGLGYANLGALLLVLGIAYDSDEGRDLAASITALMTGAAYYTSAKMAKVLGAFDGFAENREHMLNVIKLHSALVDGHEEEGETEDIWESAENYWDLAVDLGEQYGFRNAQVSVLAPTGTISFLMDCDTTGIEPALALVVYKKLVGGGSVKMPNRLVKQALYALGHYCESEIEEILRHVEETGDIVGARALRPTDARVFATAIGANNISWMGHLSMMAAVQPFISGAISKTVNLPETATVEDIEFVYMTAWQLGLKAVAVYRNGCKLSQPAGTKLAPAQGAKAEPEVVELKWGDRKKLPATRNSRTHKLRIGGAEGYVTVGLQPDGTPGEIFITMAQEGSTLRGFMDLAATAISIGLQHGVPLTALIDKMKHMKFEPAGFTDNEDIRMAESIPDYIGRWLEREFLMNTEPVEADAAQASVAAVKKIVTQGFNGPPCSKCSNLTQRAGSCWVCTACGTTTGCG